MPHLKNTPHRLTERPAGFRLLPVAMLLAVSALPPSAAQAAPGLETGLRACAELAADSARLACFDALVPGADESDDPLLAERPAAENPAAESPVEEGPVADPERAFGVETLPPRVDSRGEAVDAIESRIEGLQRRPYGEYVFELANGQRWTQLESGRARYRRGQAVTIERTTLGAYMLSTEAGRATRVRRLD